MSSHYQRNHPSALDISFGDSPPAILDAEETGYNQNKRSIDTPEPNTAQSNLPPSFRPNEGIPREKKDTVIPGEPLSRGEKPVRILNNFTFFSLERDALAELDDLAHDSYNSTIEGVGEVLAVRGDEMPDEDEDVDEPILLRLAPIINASIDYEKHNDPFYIETGYAWYRLGVPSVGYFPLYVKFYMFHRMAQIAVSSLLVNTSATTTDLLTSATNLDHTILGREPDVRDLIETSEMIKSVIRDYAGLSLDVSNRLLGCPLLKSLTDGSALTVRQNQAEGKRGKVDLPNLSNPEQAVLQAKNQNQTVVTPLVHHLSQGLFREIPYQVNFGDREHEHLQPGPSEVDFVDQLLKGFCVGKRRVRLDGLHRISGGNFFSQGQIDEDTFTIGDTVVLAMDGLQQKLNEYCNLPSWPDKVADYFWFAKLISITDNLGKKAAHVHWFEHSSKTYLEEVSDSRELFMTHVCDDVPFLDILGKVSCGKTAASCTSHAPEPSFYCKMEYIESKGEFLDLPEDLAPSDDPGFCMNCTRTKAAEARAFPHFSQDGFELYGIFYHPYDFIQFKTGNVTCGLGQIIPLRQGALDRRDPQIKVRLLGRLSDVAGKPKDILKDENELFLTNQVTNISFSAIIQKAYVLVLKKIGNLQAWIDASPQHFFLRFSFPTLHKSHWSQREVLDSSEVHACLPCLTQRKETLITEVKQANQPQLKVLDLFAGTGAFSLGMKASGAPLKLTHAIEISPSAAKSLCDYTKDEKTIVYNQCANEMLHYAVKFYNGFWEEEDHPSCIRTKAKVPPPPEPKSIDIVVAGFPCQPHSTLNMFQKADDKKSNLILNLLSWVDFLKPKFCFFENVRGFLQFSLNATQLSQYRVGGGIKMGGLKFLAYTLLAMNYQVRFSLLQAGHYGTPQSRVRFFLFAAKSGQVLPELPQPSHTFPQVDKLEIKLPHSNSITPVITGKGLAARNFITIEDAISDLPQFDWYCETASFSPSGDHLEPAQFKVDETRGRAGYINGEVLYDQAPQTAYQRRCRETGNIPEDLQHFTQSFNKDTVKRVINVPLESGADYRRLNLEIQQYQTSHPLSAVAKGGFKAGPYGRLSRDHYFHAIVTNIGPTAKQSWVLHPSVSDIADSLSPAFRHKPLTSPQCRRIVTVRELARLQGFTDDYTFHSEGGNVKTMHRQIGNAVAWPVSIAIGQQFTQALLRQKNSQRQEVIDSSF